MFQSKSFGILTRSFLPLLAAVHVAAAATNTVTTSADDNSSGTLRRVISDSVSGDTIIFAPALSGATIVLTNYASIDFITNSALVVNKSLTIDASALPGGIIIDGHHWDSVFKVNAGTNIFTGLTITNGYAYPGYQGWLAGDGGGILNNAVLTLNRCTFVGNTAIPNPGSSFPPPIPGHGGGGVANFGTLTVNECIFAGNNSGLYNDALLVINSSTFSSNSGFAIQNGRSCPKYCATSGAQLTVNQCTITGNPYGVYTVSTNPVFINQSTLAGNSGNTLDGYFTLSNSIVAGTNWPYSTFTNNANNIVTTSNVNLSPLGYYGGLTPTMPPLPGSPAIDNGNDSLTNIFTTDQRGTARFSNLHVDIGAVETAVTPGVPGANTLPATGLGLTNATLNALVNQNHAATTCYFQYGTTTNYGFATAVIPINTGIASVSNTLVGLSQGTLYHFRIVATNSAGIAFGDDRSFQTGVIRLVSNTNDSGPGSLRLAVSNFAAGDTITFDPNLSGQTILLTSGQITISNSLTLDASTLPAGLAIDGHANGRIFLITNNVTALLDSLTMTNGKALSEGGGGIYNQGVLTLKRCVVAGNTASSSGGGIYNIGTLVLDTSAVSGNTATANTGGGLYSANSLTLDKCTIAGNTAATGGGGIYSDGYLTVNQSTFSGNSSSNAGGIFVAAFAAINQSTLSGNYASFDGGGIYKKWPAGLNVFNSIIAGNFAGRSSPWGPNIYVEIISYPTYEPQYLGNNLTNSNPLLAPLGNYGGRTQTMPPTPSSPAIDACLSGTTFTNDQRGFPRPLDGNGDSIAVADIGSMEGFVYYGPGILSGMKKVGNSAIQFGFPNDTGKSFTVFASPELAAPLETWSNLGPAVETPAGSGQYQFTDPGATNAQRFYRVRSP